MNVWRCGDVYSAGPQAGRLQDRCDHRRRRTLAGAAADVHDRHRLVRISKVAEQLTDARLKRALDRHDREFVPEALLEVVDGRVVAFERHGQA